ncbi:MAG: type II secretion system protein, partial [Chloroflexota bacterium]
RQERGFTLIELLIVLAILGILVGIVAMSVGGLTETSTKRSMSSEYETVQTAIDTYNTQNVAVEMSPTLEARTFEILDPSDNVSETIGLYLKRETKYEYAWGEGGEPLTVTNNEITYTLSGWQEE